MSDYTKYTDSLSMMDNIVAKSDGVNYDIEKDECKELHSLWDELYTYVYANFKEPESRRSEADEKAGKCVKESVAEVTPEVKDELKSMMEMFRLNREEIEEQLYKIPPVILEQCFPVWMARYMLCFGQVPVMPTHLTTFNKFHSMYGYMIIYSHEA